ncbi:hypothetical protein CPB85DRAFT_842713 [Mucidula mucida]|nr:hypothetical protein CPB85DRAFT_842713 [Mucidula mucida]
MMSLIPSSITECRGFLSERRRKAASLSITQDLVIATAPPSSSRHRYSVSAIKICGKSSQAVDGGLMYAASISRPSDVGSCMITFRKTWSLLESTVDMPLVAQNQVDALTTGFIREEIELAFYGFYAATAIMSVVLLMYVHSLANFFLAQY